jgi:hypothetical protein
MVLQLCFCLASCKSFVIHLSPFCAHARRASYCAFVSSLSLSLVRALSLFLSIFPAAAPPLPCACSLSDADRYGPMRGVDESWASMEGSKYWKMEYNASTEEEISRLAAQPLKDMVSTVHLVMPTTVICPRRLCPRRLCPRRLCPRRLCPRRSPEHSASGYAHDGKHMLPAQTAHQAQS